MLLKESWTEPGQLDLGNMNTPRFNFIYPINERRHNIAPDNLLIETEYLRNISFTDLNKVSESVNGSS